VRTPGTVLIVDDDAAVLDLLQGALRDEGYAVMAADNAGDALDLLMTLWDRQPDAILLDIQLPTVGGQDFAELYRLLPVTQAPIILISAAPGVQEVARQIQAEDVLSKPFDLEDLLSRVQQVTLGKSA
jgi:CheY-like chemotaxis protein